MEALHKHARIDELKSILSYFVKTVNNKLQFTSHFSSVTMKFIRPNHKYEISLCKKTYVLMQEMDIEIVIA